MKYETSEESFCRTYSDVHIQTWKWYDYFSMVGGLLLMIVGTFILFHKRL